MEQAAAGTLTGLFAQLGIAGFILAVLIAGAVWYLKASKDLRGETRGVIAELKADNTALKNELVASETKVSDLTRALLDCQFPGRMDPE